MPVQVGFRCPDDILLKIENHAKETGTGRSAAILQLVEGMPSIPVESRKQIPETEAVYIVWTKLKLLYIGQTLNLNKRICQHERLPEFLNRGAKVAWFGTEGYDRLEIEANLISTFSPVLNKMHNDDWERASTLNPKTRRLQLTVNKEQGDALKRICDRLGLAEAEYLRGALMARLRRDERYNKETIKEKQVKENEGQAN